LKSDERKHRSTSAITRPNITYKNDASTSTSHHRRSQRHYGLAAIKRPIPTHDRVLAPHTPALTGRPDPGADHDLADARRGDLDPKTKQLAGDPPLPPPRVLPSEPQDQLANLQADPGTNRDAAPDRPSDEQRAGGARPAAFPR
jgi:hypothetical protein